MWKEISEAGLLLLFDILRNTEMQSPSTNGMMKLIQDKSNWTVHNPFLQHKVCKHLLKPLFFSIKLIISRQTTENQRTKSKYIKLKDKRPSK